VGIGSPGMGSHLFSLCTSSLLPGAAARSVRELPSRLRRRLNRRRGIDSAASGIGGRLPPHRVATPTPSGMARCSGPWEGLLPFDPRRGRSVRCEELVAARKLSLRLPSRCRRLRGGSSAARAAGVLLSHDRPRSSGGADLDRHAGPEPSVSVVSTGAASTPPVQMGETEAPEVRFDGQLRIGIRVELLPQEGR
jgi:hypothetical protein